MESKDCTFKRSIWLAGPTLPLQQGWVAGPVSQHPLLGEVVIVEWSNGTLQKVTVHSLLTSEEANAKELEMKTAASKFEEEFSKVEKSIKEKLAKASELIMESASLAESVGEELSAMSVASVLESAMDEAGWNTSSWSC